MGRVIRWRTLLTLCGLLLLGEVCGDVQETTTAAAAATPWINAVIGVIMKVHERGPGLFGCGLPTQEGMIMVEAMRWMMTNLNKESGESFLPGVSIDVRVSDTCGRMPVALSQLGELYPNLRWGNDTTKPVEQLGLIDGVGLYHDPEVKVLLDESQVPVVSLDTTYIAATERVKAILAMMKTLQWHRMVVIYGDDEYSIQMFNSFIELVAENDEICVISAEKYISSSNESSIENDIFNKNVFDVLLSAKNSKDPILALMSTTSHMPFSTTLQHILQSNNNDYHFDMTKRKIEILFSDLLRHKELDLLPKDVLNIYSLSVLPDNVPAFEEYWQERIHQVKVSMESGLQEEDWLAEYIRMQSCNTDTLDWSTRSISECNAFMEDSLDIALRTRAVITASTAILLLAEALKQAWNAKCLSSAQNVCPLLELSSEEFQKFYVKPIIMKSNLFRPKEDLYTDEDSSHNFVLVSYQNGTSTLNKVILYNQFQELHILEESFVPSFTNSCLINEQGKRECKDCLHLRHDRINASRHYGHLIDKSQQLYSQTKMPKYQLLLQPNYHVLIRSPQNLYLSALFSVHQGSNDKSFLRCEELEEVDLDTVRQVEAFLWALQRVNFHLHKYSTHGIQLGALLLDTCNSHTRTMTLTAGLDSFNHQTGGYQILASVNALPYTDAKVADQILASLNITTVSTGQSAALTDKSIAKNPYILQVDASLSKIISAIINTLKHLGWDYISVVYSEYEEELISGYKQFQTVAAAAGVCLALEESINDVTDSKEDSNEKIDDLVTHLVGARASGARAVVLWTNPRDTRALMQAMGQAIAHGTLRREDLFWLLASPNGQAHQVLQQAGNVLGGALVFSPQHRPVREFMQHLHQVQPESKNVDSNPWLKKYYQEVLQCNGPTCKHHQDANNHADFNTIQAVYSIGAAVSNMLSDLCSNSSESANCFNKYSRMDIQQTFNHYLHQSVTERADGITNEDFYFTTSGVGNIPVEILNFRRKLRDRSRSLGDVFYDKVGIFTNGTLMNLNGMVAYRDSGDEIEVSALTSQCGSRSSCSQCQGRHNKLSSSDWVSVTTPQDTTLYIAATFQVHEPSQHPLECGTEINKIGIEQLEAFLWAIDQVNLNYTHLNLAAIALDTCGSIVKTSRDISDFLNHQEANIISQKDLGTSNSVVAFVADGRSEIASAVMDAVGHRKMPVLVPQAGGPPPHRKKFSPYPLQLAPTNIAHASALLALLRHLKWTCFSVIYYQDGVEYEDIFRHMEKHADGLKLSTSIPLPLGSPNLTLHIRGALRKLQELQVDGIRVAVLLLPPEKLEVVLRTAQALEDEGQLTPGALTWVTLGSQQVIEAYRELSLGALVLKPSAGKVPEFEKYFQKLNLTSNTRNPWFSQFWSSVFHCRGASCYNKLYQDLQSYQFNHNPSVVNTINSVLAIAHALGTVKRELCPEQILGGSSCRAMKNVERVRHRLFEVTPHMAFVGVGLNAVAFSNTGENSHADIEILNYHRVANGGYKLMKVGQIQSTGYVQLDFDKTKGYVAENRTEVPVHDIASQCSRIHPFQRETTKVPMVMEVPSNRKFSLLGIMPVHHQGAGNYDCGKIQLNSMLHVAAFCFALERVNRNASLLPGIDLGATLLDSCSRPSHVYSTIYNFLSLPNDASTRMHAINIGTKPEDIVGALIIDMASAETTAPLLDAQGILQLSIPAKTSTRHGIKLSSSNYMETLINSEDLVEAMLSIIQVLHSHSVIVVRGTTSWAGHLTQRLENHTSLNDDLCLAGVYVLHSKNMNDLVGAISSTNMMVTKEVTKKLRPGTTVILLLEDPKETDAFLNVCQAVDGLVFLTILQSMDIKLNSGHPNVITLSPDFQQEKNRAHISDGFHDWLKSNLLTTDSNGKFLFPRIWINEFKEAYNTTFDIENQEKLSEVFTPNLEDTMHAVWAIAKGLHHFLNNHCAHHFQTNSLYECGNNATHINNTLHEQLLHAISLEYNTKNFSVWKGINHVGTWEKGNGLTIINRASLSNFLSDCNSMDCTECGKERGAYSHIQKQPTIYHNFQFAWASALGGITLLGTLFTILTALYFLSAAALPNTKIAGGTSVLGYLILLGLLLLFASNLSFVLAPTQTTCGARRFLPGFSYALIFAGMLIKVFTTWRQLEDQTLEDGSGHPATLLIAAVALALIQVLLSGGWLLLIPPQVYTITTKDSTLWRCYPKGNFETHLLLSLVYVLLLLSSASILALLCCSSSKRKYPAEMIHLCHEARWIFISSILVVTVFTFWGITTVAMLSPGHADLASALAHLMAAKILLLCLYVPKILLYTRLKSNKAAPQSSYPPIYDISHFHAPSVKSLSAFMPSASSVMGLDLPSMDGDDDPTQIVPSSLYSLDMFSQASSSQDDEEEGDHCEPGTNEFTAPSMLTLDEDQLSMHESISYM